MLDGSLEWYKSNFGRYTHVHGKETMEIFEEWSQPHVHQSFYTSPLVGSQTDMQEMRTVEQTNDKRLCQGFGYLL